MKLKAALTSAEFEALKGPEKEFYAEGDSGLYVLSVESTVVGGKTFSLEDVAGLKKAVAELIAKAEKRSKELAAFEGIDPAEAKAALAKVKELSDPDKLDDKVKQQVKAIEEQYDAKYKKQVEALKADNAKITGERDKAIEAHGQSYLVAEARRAFAAHKVLADWQDVMLDKVKACTRVKPDGQGGFKVEVLDADGTPRITNTQNSTDPMGVAELVSEFKTSQALAVCFEGTNASGSGAASQTGRAATGGRHVLSQADAGDAVKYRQAKERAQKAGAQLVIQ